MSVMQIKRGHTESWENGEHTLAEGQLGIEYRVDKSPRLKVGPIYGAEWLKCKYITPDADVYSDNGINKDDVFAIKINNSEYGTISTFTFGPLNFYSTDSNMSLGTKDNPWDTLYVNNLVVNGETTSGGSGNYLPLTGGTINGDLYVDKIYLTADAITEDNQVVTKKYVDTTGFNKYLNDSENNVVLAVNKITADPLPYNNNVQYNYLILETTVNRNDAPCGIEFRVGAIMEDLSTPHIIKFENDQGVMTFHPDNKDSRVSMMGIETNKWTYGYFDYLNVTNTSQTSDRAAKTDIQYLTGIQSYSVLTNNDNISMNTVIDFIQKLEPATFVYKVNNSDIASTDPEAIQLGIIADDIYEHPLFKYVGTERTYGKDAEVKRSIKLLPMTVTALTACKYLLEKNQ